MNKTELIKIFAKQTNLNLKKSKEAVDVLIQIIVTALERGEEVQLSGFGKFWAKYYKGTLKNVPNTGILSKISPRFVPKFRPSSCLKRRFEGVFG